MEQHDRRSNLRRLVVTITVSHVALLVCTAVSLYVYVEIRCRLLDVKNEDDNRDIFIQFHAIGDISENQTLKFTYFESREMNLTDDRVIHVPCNGPYILHVYACTTGLDGREGQGSLELRLAETKRAVASLALAGSRSVACQGLHATVYLRKQQRATLYFSSGDQNLKIKNVTLGLHYLLGRCQR